MTVRKTSVSGDCQHREQNEGMTMNGPSARRIEARVHPKNEMGTRLQVELVGV